jgi:exonuclease VII small subunit
MTRKAQTPEQKAHARFKRALRTLSRKLEALGSNEATLEQAHRARERAYDLTRWLSDPEEACEAIAALWRTLQAQEDKARELRQAYRNGRIAALRETTREQNHAEWWKR